MAKPFELKKNNKPYTTDQEEYGSNLGATPDHNLRRG